jgi:hypothetical protein
MIALTSAFPIACTGALATTSNIAIKPRNLIVQDPDKLRLEGDILQQFKSATTHVHTPVTATRNGSALDFGFDLQRIFSFQSA